jgi:hypothetical protein
MGLYLLIPTFAIIIISVLIVQAGAIALRMTGLDEKTANFQALSAFTRAGFTTSESEAVLKHPQRRGIVTWLIILGNAGIVAVIVTGTSSLVTATNYVVAIDIGILVIGTYIIYRLVRHSGLLARWEVLVENRLVRGSFFKGIHVEHLLHMPEGYGIGSTTVVEGSSAVGQAVAHGRLQPADFTVLGIERSGNWLPVAHLDETVREGDTLIIFGKLTEIEQVFEPDRTRRR